MPLARSKRRRAPVQLPLPTLPNNPPFIAPDPSLPNIPEPIPGIGDPTTFPPMPPLDPRLPNMPPLWPLFPWILPFNPPVIDDDIVVFTSGGPGQWVNVDESMSDRAREYQRQITGRTGEAYVVNGVRFDGWSHDERVLIEAKSYFEQFLNSDGSWLFPAVPDGFIEQAQRQLAVAGGIPIRWYFAEERVADKVRELFDDQDINIEVIPKSPQ